MRTQILMSWDSCVEAFKAGHVVSERTLQAQFYSQLCEGLPSQIVVCEPRLESKQFGPFYPDILILSHSEIVAAVEIKFVPQGFPRFEGGLAKLTQYAGTHNTFNILLNPQTGKYSEQLFHFSPTWLLIFGAIGRQNSVAADSAELSQRMVQFGTRFVPCVYSVPYNS